MAWTAPKTFAAGELVTAAMLNTYISANDAALRAGGIAIGSQGANEIIFASSSSQLSRSASFTYNGTVLAVSTAGTHLFSATTTGENVLTVRNLSNGAAAKAVHRIGNDTNADVGNFTATSSTFNTAVAAASDPPNFADAVSIIARNGNGTTTGGLNHVAANGPQRFYAGNATAIRMYIHGGGGVSIGTGAVDPGNTNFRVEGTSTLVGTVTHSGTTTLTGTTTAAAINASAAVNISSSLQCDSIVNDTGLAAGVYTPTLTNTTNLDASTAIECQYLRVGNTVYVSGSVNVDATAATPTQFVLGISLPIASNLGVVNDLTGVAVSAGAGLLEVGVIIGDTTNDRASLVMATASTSNQPIYFNFGYQVI